VDPELARQVRAEAPPTHDESTCSMCGEFCAIKVQKDHPPRPSKPSEPARSR